MRWSLIVPLLLAVKGQRSCNSVHPSLLRIRADCSPELQKTKRVFNKDYDPEESKLLRVNNKDKKESTSN